MRIPTSPAVAARRLRVTLEEPAETTDGLGGVTRSYAPRVTLWARLQPSTGIERGEAQRAESTASHQLTIRWRGDVTGAMRFSAAGRLFTVTASFDPDGLKRNLVCLVEEVSP